MPARQQSNKLDLTWARALTLPKRSTMNSFQLHHRDSIQFGYSCFDRMIVNGCVLRFMHTSRGGSIRWFLRAHRGFADVSRACLAKIAAEYHGWVDDYALQAGLDIVEPEKG